MKFIRIKRNTINFVSFLFFLALKKSYVDVFNPSGAAPKNDTPILAPMMPTLPTQPSFFVPAAVPNNNQQNVSTFNCSFFILFSSLQLQTDNTNLRKSNLKT